jgi:hypothetical protein
MGPAIADQAIVLDGERGFGSPRQVRSASARCGARMPGDTSNLAIADVAAQFLIITIGGKIDRGPAARP